MRILILGGAGVLGSALANRLNKEGYKVSVLDIVREEEAWRLEEDIPYIWMSSWDLKKEDVENYDVIFDVAIFSADRPFGDTSPLTTIVGNVLPPLTILEILRRTRDKIVIYASSFNACYAHKHITEDTLPDPTSIYGYTKASAELLYRVYNRSYNVKSIITRVGSAFGEGGRSDELPHRLIIYGLKRRKFTLRSPHSKRLWTYSSDVLDFYGKLLERLGECVGLTLHCCGNKSDEILTNIELANKIKRFIPSLEYGFGGYEPGELRDGEPISFTFDAEFTRKLLNWKPRYSIDDGLENCMEWFKKNIERYKTGRFEP